ncbi:MAG: DnaJ domain-containing protein, partial [Bacteroidales bacterium]|nr:DnaJ domain-containing protein [Bacteroidales bacterium]
MTLEDYFHILGLPADSSLDDVKKAYRQKARLYHPDIN